MLPPRRTRGGGSYKASVPALPFGRAPRPKNSQYLLFLSSAVLEVARCTVDSAKSKVVRKRKAAQNMPGRFTRRRVENSASTLAKKKLRNAVGHRSFPFAAGPQEADGAAVFARETCLRESSSLARRIRSVASSNDSFLLRPSNADGPCPSSEVAEDAGKMNRPVSGTIETLQ